MTKRKQFVEIEPGVFRDSDMECISAKTGKKGKWGIKQGHIWGVFKDNG